MGASPRQAGLAVIVRYGRHEERQTVASCDDPARGSALGDTGRPVLDLAACDGLYRLVRRSRTVVVERESGDAGIEVVSTIRLPDGIRVVQSHIGKRGP